MDDEEIPAEFRRTANAIEANKQAKYRRWADEMQRHGWDVHQPSERKVAALALQDARKRMEQARLDAARR